MWTEFSDTHLANAIRVTYLNLKARPLTSIDIKNALQDTTKENRHIQTHSRFDSTFVRSYSRKNQNTRELSHPSAHIPTIATARIRSVWQYDSTCLAVSCTNIETVIPYRLKIMRASRMRVCGGAGRVGRERSNTTTKHKVLVSLCIDRHIRFHLLSLRGNVPTKALRTPTKALTASHKLESARVEHDALTDLIPSGALLPGAR